MAKLGTTVEAIELLHKMVAMGALEMIGASVVKMLHGPVHYLPIQAVFKDSTVTTSLRLVTNSSCVHLEIGLS